MLGLSSSCLYEHDIVAAVGGAWADGVEVGACGFRQSPCPYIYIGIPGEAKGKKGNVPKEKHPHNFSETNGEPVQKHFRINGDPDEPTLKSNGKSMQNHAKTNGESDQTRFKTNGNPANHITKAIGNPAKPFQNKTNGESYQNMSKPIGNPS